MYAVNHAPKQQYQTWQLAHPPHLAFIQHGSQTVDEWQAELRAKLRDCLGVQPELIEPEAHLLESTRHDDYVRERWVLRTETDFWLPFYLLLPKNSIGRMPTVIALNGHGPGKSRTVGIASALAEEEIIRDGHEDYGLQAVREGYIAFCPDQRGFGEATDEDHLNQPYHVSCQYSAGRSLMLGRSLLGERIWDVSRTIDWLNTRADVEPGRIACVGHSGGGTAALFASALEPRIKAAVVNGYLCSWGRSIYAVGHCPCNYVPNLAQYADCGDIGGLIAPRPLLINAGEQDDIFPIDGAQDAYETVLAAYAESGAADRTQFYVGPDGHRFYPEPVWPFLRRWL
jgi:pimeloyl-ACP methyl ester carboxylesterase